MRNGWLVPALAFIVGGGSPGFAAAQDAEATLSLSASEMYESCVANGGSATECACTAGFYGGRLRADEFRLASVLNAYIGADGELTDVAAALNAMQSEALRMGITDKRLTEILERFHRMDADGTYGDKVCTVLANR